jgi:hypothetical protein
MRYLSSRGMEAKMAVRKEQTCLSLNGTEHLNVALMVENYL